MQSDPLSYILLARVDSYTAVEGSIRVTDHSFGSLDPGAAATPGVFIDLLQFNL